MKTTRPLAAAMFATALAFALPALAHEERCEPIPKAEWKPQAELEKKLTDSGWKVKRVKIENGCYEVYGTDEKGKKAEVFFHPKTLERVVAAKK
jgi:hypothetical protein